MTSGLKTPSSYYLELITTFPLTASQMQKLAEFFHLSPAAFLE